MLQYLTDDLMSGYGLPKKRMSVGVWSLRDSVVSHRGTRLIPILQTSDITAIGQATKDAYTYALHTDGRIHIISFTGFYSLEWSDLYRYLE